MTGVRWLCVMALASISAFAQNPIRFSSGTAAVRVDVLVTSGNRPVPGLKASDFELRDNGVIQQITDVSQEMLPLNVFCVLDLSSSVNGQPLVRLKDATGSLFGTLRENDRAALMTFADRLVLHAPLTSDTGRLRGLLGGLKAGGQTSFLDATFAALALRESDERRALMLLFSDGEDTSSWLRAQPVIESARRTDVVIYPVTIRKPRVSVSGVSNSASSFNITRYQQKVVAGDDVPEKLLEELAEETGGRVIYVENDEKLQATFVQVLSEFRQRYVLSYSPANVTADGWHTIDVTITGKRAQVKARRGYAAEPASRGGAAKEQ